MMRNCRFFLLLLAVGTAWSTHAYPADDAASMWPAFRGPLGNGHAPGGGGSESLPVTWSETENVTWKIPIPHVGWSTPVILNGKLWLTTATETGHEYFVMGIDTKTGAVIFDEKLFDSANPEPLGNNVNGYASPSSFVEPGRLYVHFGRYGTACIDTESHEVLWRRDDLECRHYRGPGSSIIVFENLLILTFDGVDTQYVAALDKRTGDTVWKTERTTVFDDLDENGEPFMEGDRRKAFSTPMVVDVDGRLILVSVGSSTAFGYDARTGEEVWKVRNPSHTPSASPIVMGKTAFITTGYGGTELKAIRLDGRGDVTDTHVEWIKVNKHVPAIPSPILVDGLIYTVSDRGQLSCTEAATGEEVWTARVGGSYMASPVYAGGRIYFSSVQGKTTVLEPGRTFKELASNELDDGFMASPAVAEGAIFLRTKTHLYRIELAKAQTSPKAEASAKSGFFTSDGLKIHYDVFGSGDPLVLVPGWGAGNTRTWVDTGWVEALKEKRLVIALEPRGLGKSDKPHDAKAYSYSTMSRDVIALLDHLDIARADYMGYSMGAFMGAYLLGHHGERFGSMILGGIGDETPESAAACTAIAAALRAPKLADISDPLGMGYRMYAEADPDNDLEALALSALQMWPEGYPLQLGGEGLRTAEARVLVVNGENDHPYIDGDDAFVEAIPNARLVTIPGADHLSTMVHPAFKEAVLAFLAER